jgi:hypothetical protein
MSAMWLARNLRAFVQRHVGRIHGAYAAAPQWA